MSEDDHKDECNKRTNFQFSVKTVPGCKVMTERQGVDGSGELFRSVKGWMPCTAPSSTDQKDGFVRRVLL